MTVWSGREIRRKAPPRDAATSRAPLPRPIGGIALVCLLVLIARPALAEVPGDPTPIALREALVLPGSGPGGRRAIPEDPVVERVVVGTWTAPKAGG